MAQPATNPKIEELRSKLKTDPKSRLFYPLAEELRKAGQSPEAEQVLRTGLEHHSTYLSAWVSLGRALREQKKDGEAVEALSKAMQLDPGNVVAARLLGDAHLALGDKLEAIKKYKLVHALMPADEELQSVIARLDADLNPVARVEPPPPPPPAPEPEPAPAQEPEPEPEPKAEVQPQAEPPSPFAEPEAEAEPQRELEPVESLFATSEPAFSDNPFGSTEEQEEEVATGDVEPMLAAHDESPFEEPVADYTSAAAMIEAPSGFHIDPAPAMAEVAAPVLESEESDVFAPAAAEPPVAEDLANTITMADLYARQGLVDDARQIYDNILSRHPENDVVREKLAALDAPPAAPPVEASAPAVEPPAPEADAASSNRAKIERLQSWLAKMKRSEADRV
jgi:tetratricopeptide (TPR) repeat protein